MYRLFTVRLYWVGIGYVGSGRVRPRWRTGAVLARRRAAGPRAPDALCARRRRAKPARYDTPRPTQPYTPPVRSVTTPSFFVAHHLLAVTMCFRSQTAINYPR